MGICHKIIFNFFGLNVEDCTYRSSLFSGYPFLRMESTSEFTESTLEFTSQQYCYDVKLTLKTLICNLVDFGFQGFKS